MYEEQLSFESLETPHQTLKLKLEKIISDVCQKQDVDVKYISLEEIKDGYSIRICEPIDLKESSRVFSVTYKNTVKTKRYDVSINYKRINNVEIPAEGQLIEKKVKHKDSNGDIHYEIKTNVYFPLTSDSVFDYLYKVFDFQLGAFEPSEKFGCCSKYVECSDAKECLYGEKFYARACYYKGSLENGKIFYGKNCNVD